MIKAYKPDKKKTTTKSAKTLTPQLRKIQDNLASNLSSRVKLKLGKKGKGEIVIYFHSDEDLERLTELLSE